VVAHCPKSGINAQVDCDFCFSLPHEHAKKMTMLQAKNQLEAAGLKIEEQSTCSHPSIVVSQCAFPPNNLS